MRIEFIVCPEYIEEKLEFKNRLTCDEVEQVLQNQPRFRFAEKGHSEGDDVYVTFGQTLRADTCQCSLSTNLT
jgi:hypothetical protein